MDAVSDITMLIAQQTHQLHTVSQHIRIKYTECGATSPTLLHSITVPLHSHVPRVVRIRVLTLTATDTCRVSQELILTTNLKLIEFKVLFFKRQRK